MSPGLKILLTIHAVITLAAGIVLIVAPAAIPATVDIQMQPGEYLLSYFVGAAEIAIAWLSFSTRKITDRHALRIIVTTCIVFHAATGLLEMYALFQGSSIKLTGNIMLRLAVVALFYYYGIVKTKTSKTDHDRERHKSQG